MSYKRSLRIHRALKRKTKKKIEYPENALWWWKCHGEATGGNLFEGHVSLPRFESNPYWVNDGFEIATTHFYTYYKPTDVPDFSSAAVSIAALRFLAELKRKRGKKVKGVMHVGVSLSPTAWKYYYDKKTGKEFRKLHWGFIVSSGGKTTKEYWGGSCKNDDEALERLLCDVLGIEWEDPKRKKAKKK